MPGVLFAVRVVGVLLLVFLTCVIFFFGVWCTLEHALMLGETVRLANLSLKKDGKQKQERIKKSFILADVCVLGRK